MKSPRVSIVTLMAVVGVVAADCVILRDEGYTTLPPVGSREPFLWLIVPLIDAITVCGVITIRQVIRERTCGASIFGFVTIGTMIVMALVATYGMRQGVIDAYLRFDKDWIDGFLRRVGLVDGIHTYYTPFWHDLATPAIVCPVISAPTFLLPVLGAWAFHKARIRVVRSDP